MNLFPKWTGICIMFMAGVSCLPFSTHTAEVKPGYSIDLSANPIYYRLPYYTSSGSPAEIAQGIGGFLGASGFHTFRKPGNLGFHWQAGYELLRIQGWDENDSLIISGFSGMPGVGLGLQWEFLEKPSLALDLNASFEGMYLNEIPIPDLSLALLAGIDSPKDNREIITIGLRPSLLTLPSLLINPSEPIIRTSAFMTCHFSPRLHFLLAATYSSGNLVIPYYDMNYRFMQLQAGISYSIFAKKPED